MPFSVQPHDRITLFFLNFFVLDLYAFLVLTWWVFTPSALRLVIELLHARPRLDKAWRKSIRLVGTIALLFSLSLPSEKKNFLFTFSTTDAFDIGCRLVRNDSLDDVPQINKKKAADFINKTLLVLSLAVPRES